MTSKSYSTKEIDLLFKGIEDSFDNLKDSMEERRKANDQRIDVMESNITTELAEIKEQTKATNGSVAAIKAWQQQGIGAFKAISIMGVAIIGILGWALYSIDVNNSHIAAINAKVNALQTK